jgi:hypothetical protein
MPNPRAQQQLAQVSPNPLDRAVHSLKSISQPAQALGDMLASTLRGSTAATLGAGGDIRELVDLLGPEKVEAMLGKRVLPTTEEMKGMLPKATSYEHPYESIGEFLPLPGTGAAMKAASYGAGRGAGALTRAAGQAVSDAMIHQAGPLASGPLSALAPRMAMTNVVKPKGGNWMDSSTNINLDKLKSSGKDPVESLAEMDATYTPEAIENLPPALKDYVKQSFQDLEKKAALNNWIDKTVKGYVKNEMATPEDRVRLMLEKRYAEIEAKFAKDQERAAKMADRAAAESDPRRKANLSRQAQEMAAQATDERDLSMQHIAHIPSERLEANGNWLDDFTAAKRKNAGYPEEGMAQTGPAKGWEIMADQEIKSTPAGQSIYEGSRDLERYPWLAKLDKSTPVYRTEGSFHKDLGFDHVMDVLKEGITEGRITPEQLSKITMDQAVKMAADYDLGKAKAMREAAIKTQKGFPVHKEYPEGYKWLELKMPEPKLNEGETIKYLPEVDMWGIYDPQGGTISSGATEREAMGLLRREERMKQLEEALKYEGDVMGHCVGGYCPDVAAGRSRIFSLRDSKGEPHVTVEAYPPRSPGWAEVKEAGGDPLAVTEEAKRRMGITPENESELMKSWDGDRRYQAKQELEKHFADIYREQFGEPPSRIAQIKGKQNLAPKEDYLPFVQDFVKGGRWSEVGDLQNTGLYKLDKDFLGGVAAHMPEAEDIRHLKRDQREEALMKAMEAGDINPGYVTRSEWEDAVRKHGRPTYGEDTDELLRQLQPPEEGMKAGGCVSISDNQDRMWMEVQDQKFAGGGLTKLAKLARAPAKTKAEIEAIAERMAPQVTGEYVRASEKSAKTVAGKTKKQFEREKELQHDIRPTGAERPLPKAVNIEDLKNQVMMGIAGDPTITGQTIHSIGGRELRSPSPQHGGPLYGLGHDKEHFWASNLGAARNVQNRAREIGEQYDAPVVGNYVMMGPDSYSYAQHFADANLQNIRPEEMTKAQIEGFNKLVRQGSVKSGPRPTWAGIENPEEAYLQMAIDPELRKHFGNLMQMPTVTEAFGLPSGLDVRHAVTEPDLRDLQIGVTGKSMGLMRPDVTNLKLSEHPTYSHDIPGEFIGGLKFPVPYELSFPDSLKAVRENPAQAPQEFGSFKMAGPRQIIDQQLIDEIKAYEERMRQLTGKADGGAVKQLSQTAQEHLAKLKAIRDQLAPVADAWTAKQAEDTNKYTPDIQQFKLPMGKAAGGEISADDIILEERPL